jgi:hypothetical protein
LGKIQNGVASAMEIPWVEFEVEFGVGVELNPQSGELESKFDFGFEVPTSHFFLIYFSHYYLIHYY